MTVPPIRRAVIVDATLASAFAVFTDELASWWPIDNFGVFGAGGTVAIDAGEIVEVSASGEKAHWGSVTEWEPPHRIAFTWHPGHPADSQSSRVEVSFTDLDDHTLVVLEHSGWEVFDDPASARANYANGWPTVVATYAAHLADQPDFVVLQHRRGPAADPDQPVFAQPGFAEHVAFLSRLEAKGLVLAAGPFPESDGEGMTVLRLPDGIGVTEAIALATEDDTSVASGFLDVEVRRWQVVVRG
jgi:uncharacterized protein YndB with AHSA1/START domain/uncharacterized protein YciI